MKCSNIKCKNEHKGSYGSGKYCSRQCANARVFTKESKIKKSIKTKNAWKDGAYINTNYSSYKIIKSIKQKCLNVNCQTIISVYPSANKKYCSRKCRDTCHVFKELKTRNTKKTYLDGKLVYGGTTKWIEVITSNGVIKVQGSYEVRACNILDKWKLDGKIKDWEYTNDRIKYIGEDDKQHSYLLDFKVWNNDCSFYYIETKGYKKNNDNFKWKEMEKQNLKLIVWYKEELKELEMV